MSRNTLDQFHADPANWKLGLFYFCREDRRILVPKRIRGLGWTLNFARPMAIPALLLTMFLGFAVITLARQRGEGHNVIFMLALVGIAAVAALSYFVSRPKA